MRLSCALNHLLTYLLSRPRQLLQQYALICCRRYPKKGETDGRKAPYQNILMNDAGNLSTKAGQPWPVSATSTNQFTPSGQYFVLDPEHTEA